MRKVPITIATWDYDRIQPIRNGKVEVEGCDVNYLTMPPEECFHRAYLHQEFEVSEIGFSPYLIAVSRGETPYVAIPVFLSRMFRHSAIYIRNDRGIEKPEDLRGKKIGCPEYQMSAVMWPRGMFQDLHRLSPNEINWFQGGLENPGRKDKFELNLPENFPLQIIPDDCSLSEMLERGDLDAVISARAPSCYRKKGVPVIRLFENYKAAEQEYYRKTKIFPIMHALGIRKDILKKEPWIAMSLYKAFVQAKKMADEEFFEVTALKIGLPWIGIEAQETRVLMGHDFWPYGISDNRPTLEAMTRYSFEQGLANRKLNINELFVSSTIDSIKV